MTEKKREAENDSLWIDARLKAPIPKILNF